MDLGSNSFHMVLGRLDQSGRVTFVDQAKEYVRLAGGLGPDNVLSELAMQRALDCLARFGERLGGLEADKVRVVGTNTLRKAQNSEAFVERAEAVLGYPIDIVSGLEEARLIYQGVAVSFDRPGARVVVDIGGGSTEVMLGDVGEPTTLHSLHMGCVSWTGRFFPRGRLDEASFDRAALAARRELSGVSKHYRDAFVHAVGSSGTARALDRVLLATGIGPDGITQRALDRLQQTLIAAGHQSKIELPEISSERAQVLPGGLAILRAVMRSLHIERMTTVDTAMREGILLELVGRVASGDVRERTVGRMQARFGVDAEHGFRVSATATGLLNQVEGAWKLPRGSRQLLQWAGRLHEVGMFMRFSGYHRHGAYLVANADLPGFSRQEQGALAALIVGHRGRFDVARIGDFRPPRSVPPELVLLLRLAVRLHRSRSDSPAPEIRAQASPGRLQLRFPAGWLAERPLSVADLGEERDQCARAGLDFSFQ